MGVLNLASDGLPSVLFALVRTLRARGPLTRTELLDMCCPATLEAHHKGFKGGKQGTQTLNRWTQLGLFLVEPDDRLTVHAKVAELPREGLAEVRALGALLRELVLVPSNNEQLNVPADSDSDSSRAADITLALGWTLAQDIYELSGAGYDGEVERLELAQFGNSEPYPFRNATRWTGFKSWVPIIGFGWSDKSGLVVDPTVAVREALDQVFGPSSELAIDTFVHRLAEALPVLDGGVYRREIEARLGSSWRPTRDHEISVGLSAALTRLEVTNVVELAVRADAAKRSMLGRGYRELRQVSHVVRAGGPRA